MADREKESQNFFRMVKLIVDVGSSVLRDVLLKALAPDTLENVLQTNIYKINSLYYGRPKVLFDNEFSLLTETPPDPEKFDITLLVKVFRNICPVICPHLVPLTHNWDPQSPPGPSAISLADDIHRMRDFRNSLFAHIASTRVTKVEFQTIWPQVRTVISRMAGYGSTGLKQKVQDTIDNLLTANIDKSRLDDLLKILQKWHQEDKKELEDIKNELKQQGATVLYTRDMVSDIRNTQVKNTAQLVENTAQLEEHKTQLEENTAQLEENTAQQKEHKAQLMEHTSQLEENTAQLEQHTAQLEEHKAQLEEHKTQVGEHNAQLEEYTAQLEEHRAQLEEHKAQVNENTTQLEENTAQLEENTAQLEEHKAHLEENTAQQEKNTAQLEEHKAQLEENKAQLEEHTAQLEEHTAQLGGLHGKVEEIADKVLPSTCAKPGVTDEDKSRLQQYLKDTYKRKLDVTLLPDWEQLHVSEIFTPSILVCDGAKQNQEEERYRNLGTYKELFYNNGILQKRVVLLGEAGTGKTTFSKHLTSVWCESSTLPQFADVSDVLKQFHYFFYVSCRFAKKNESTLDMITNQLFDDENMLKVAIHVLKNHPEDCLILIDGADEWEGSTTSETGRRGDIVGLPSMTGVDGSVILITSRPWRFYALSKKTQDSFMRIKINGIEDVEELSFHILEQLEDSDPRQSSSEFLHQVREKDMYELMKIPLILLIALGSWVDDHSLHKSMCINYINMLQSFIRRSKGQADWPSSENKLQYLIPNLNDIEVKWELRSNELPDLLSKYKTLQRYAGIILSLGHLAFDLFTRDNKQSLVFSKAVCKSYLGADEENDESINVCLAFGILSKTETTMRGLKKMESYAFCHKTFQEFFAALWLASKYENEKSKLYKCIKNVDDLFDYEMLITFLCGIDPMAGKQLWLDLAEDVQIPEGRVKKVQKLVCKCMKQQEFSPIDQASDQIYFCIANIYITIDTSDEDVMLLRHVLEEYSCNVKSLYVEYRSSFFFKSNLVGENSVIWENRSSVQSLVSEIIHGRGDHSDSLSSHVLDLNKCSKLEKLDLRRLSVDGLLLPVERDRLTSLRLFYVTMNRQYLEQLSGSLSSYSCLEKLYLREVKCSEQSHSYCLPVLDLQKHNKLEELHLSYLSVEGLLLPVERDRLTLLSLYGVTMNHQYLEQVLGFLSSYSCLEKLYLVEVKCSEQSHSCCLPVLDLQKHNKLEELRLYDLSVEGLLLPVERDRLTLLWLNNVTMNHQYLEQLSGSLSSYSCLKELYLVEVKCSEQSHSCCLPVLDLQKHNKLKVLCLRDLSVKGLLLPVEGDRLTSLILDNVTMNHQYLEQLSGSLSSYSCLKKLHLYKVKCSEQSHSCCLPILDLQKHNKLQKLYIGKLSVEGLLLPVERDRFTSLKLTNVTMTHHGLEQLLGSLSSCSCLKNLYLKRVECSEQSHSCCLPVLDLQQHDKLKKLDLKDLSVEGLLLPVERDRLTWLNLINVTMNHHGLEQLSESLSSCSCLKELGFDQVKCSEQSHSCCLPVLDLQKHNKLEELVLQDLSVKGLLLPVERDMLTSLSLYNVTMNHQYLEQLSGSLSSYSCLENLILDKVKCSGQSHSCCLPVLDLQKQNKLQELDLKDLSVEGLLLPVERDRFTSLRLKYVTINHQYLEQLSGSLSSCSCLEKLHLSEVKCSEQSHSCCLPVLDLRKHNTLRRLDLSNLSVEGLLLPVERDMLTYLFLCNVTMNHHGFEQLSGSLSSYSSKLSYCVLCMRCSEHSASLCQLGIDMYNLMSE